MIIFNIITCILLIIALTWWVSKIHNLLLRSVILGINIPYTAKIFDRINGDLPTYWDLFRDASWLILIIVLIVRQQK